MLKCHRFLSPGPLINRVEPIILNVEKAVRCEHLDCGHFMHSVSKVMNDQTLYALFKHCATRCCLIRKLLYGMTGLPGIQQGRYPPR